MWSDDDGPFHGRHYHLEETLCRPAPVSSPRPRILIGGRERKTLRLVAQYADACNFVGEPAEVAHKIDVLRRHCETVGRDPDQIEVTALLRNVAPDARPDDALRGAEAYAEVGVSTVMASPAGDDPAAWLEDVFGPVMDRLSTVEAKAR